MALWGLRGPTKLLGCSSPNSALFPSDRVLQLHPSPGGPEPDPPLRLRDLRLQPRMHLHRECPPQDRVQGVSGQVVVLL